MENKKNYKWTDNPTVSGAKLDTDVLNDCLMHLKYNQEDINEMVLRIMDARLKPSCFKKNDKEVE